MKDINSFKLLSGNLVHLRVGGNPRKEGKRRQQLTFVALDIYWVLSADLGHFIDIVPFNS